MAKKMTKKELDEYLDKTGEYHDADPRNSMNSEKTGPSTLTVIIGKKKGMAYGGSVKGKKHMYAAGGSVTSKI